MPPCLAESSCDACLWLLMFWHLNAQYTPPTPLNCRVESRQRCVHNSQLVGCSLDKCEQICQQWSRVASCRKHTRRQSWPSLQFPVLLSYWGWWLTSDDVMTSLLKSYQYRSKCPQSNRYGVWSVSKLSTEYVGSRRELVENCVHTADATQLDSCVASASAVYIGHKTLG